MIDYNLAADYQQFGDDLVPSILPTGTYVGLAQKVTTGQTQNGKPKMIVTLEVCEGPYAGKQATEQLTWSPESEVARQIFSNSLNVLGASPQWILENQASFDDVAEHITGAKVEFSATEDEWNGQPRNRIRFRKNLGQGPAQGQQAQVQQAPTLGAPQQQQQQQQQQQLTPQQAATLNAPTAGEAGGTAGAWPSI